MPLSEHEQRILEEIEKRLAEEDPRLVRSVTDTSLATHLARRVRWGVAAFFLGFLLLPLVLLHPLWGGVGFVVMLGSSLIVYQHLKRMGRDQIRSMQKGGGLSITAALARLAERFRRPPGPGRG